MSFALSYIFHTPEFQVINPDTGIVSDVTEAIYCKSPNDYTIKKE
jgi:hypothetical protein